MVRFLKRLSPLGLLVGGLLWAACGPSAAPPPPQSGGGGAAPAAVVNPVDQIEIKQPVELLFWHRQTGDSEALQKKLIDEFMAANPNIKIKAETLGNYDVLYQKTLAAIQAGSYPDMVAAYESQAADYYDAKALVAFDDYISSKKYGLTQEELKDYIPSYIEAGKFSQYGGKQLTFPYTKSDHVMYTNMEVLRSLGFTKPAATYDDLLSHCRKAVSAGKQCFAFVLDVSGFDAFVYSYGGELVSSDGKKTAFEQPATLKVLQFIETLAKEKLAYQTPGQTDLQNDLLSGKALYGMRSSTSVPALASGFKDNNKWAVSNIPQGSASTNATVLFGANFSIMKSTPEKQIAAWQFIKWLTTKDVTARWGLDSSNGYFPVRQSALDTPLAKKYLEDNPRFKDAMDVSRVARVEPSVKGWQEVRSVIGDIETAVLTGKLTAVDAQKQLVEKANKVLASQ